MHHIRGETLKWDEEFDPVSHRTDPVADRNAQAGSKLLNSHEILIPATLHIRSEPKQIQDIQYQSCT
ncbi:hypothetical protein ACQKOF_10730 [Lysinibacillus sp. NPDC093190]|uniref:hypothetical protein n=1 Tax=Lysinibacillus sp. NPDC093190 TaxID=3390575 RepID=UPI003CFDBFBE